MSERAAGKHLSKVRLELKLPAGFPETHRAAIVRAVENCKVKKAIADAPAFEVAVVGSAAPSAAAQA